MEKIIQPIEPAPESSEEAQIAQNPQANPAPTPPSSLPATSTNQPQVEPSASPATVSSTQPIVGQIASAESLPAQSQPAVSAQPAKFNAKGEMPVGVSASSLGISTKPPMPKGVYAIIALIFATLVLSFFGSDTNMIYTIDMVINLLLAFGLLARVEAARIVMVVLQGLSVILTAVVLIGLILIQNRVHNLRTQTDQAISRIDTTRITSDQKENLDNTEKQLADAESQLGKQYKILYVTYGVTIVANIGIAAYLSRPKVKEAFQPT